MTAAASLVLFIVSFMVVAMLFKVPVSYSLGISSLLVLVFANTDGASYDDIDKAVDSAFN